LPSSAQRASCAAARTMPGPQQSLRPTSRLWPSFPGRTCGVRPEIVSGRDPASSRVCSVSATSVCIAPFRDVGNGQVRGYPHSFTPRARTPGGSVSQPNEGAIRHGRISFGCSFRSSWSMGDLAHFFLGGRRAAGPRLCNLPGGPQGRQPGRPSWQDESFQQPKL
jgi:hypothetical protein